MAAIIVKLSNEFSGIDGQYFCRTAGHIAAVEMYGLKTADQEKRLTFTSSVPSLILFSCAR